MLRFYLVVFLIAGQYVANAQELISSSYLKTVSTLEINLFALSIGIDFTAQYAVDLYKIQYYTPDLNGVADTASGLVVVPDAGQGPHPLVNYYHGTTDGRFDVPSGGNFIDVPLEIAFACQGFIVASPDFIGLGDSEGIHPYLHSETEFTAGVDMLLAARSFCEQQDISLSEHLFVSGYSGGGHASMASHKLIQQRLPHIEVDASAPMSGPYSLSVEMKKRILGEEEYLFPGFIAYMLNGYQQVYGSLYEDFSEYYLEPYASIIHNELSRNEYSISRLNDTLNAELMSEFGTMKPKFMFRDSVIFAIIEDSSFIVNQLLRENDTYNWIPEVPMRMYYCEADEQVVYTNALFADSAMNANGAMDVEAINVGDSLDHTMCAPQAVIRAITFFKSVINVTSIWDSDNIPITVNIFPNPIKDIMKVSIDDHLETRVHLELFSSSGALINTITNRIEPIEINISSLPFGVYLLKVTLGNDNTWKKIVKTGS